MIQIENVQKVYRARGGPVTALDDVSLQVAKGEIFGVIGRSGAGKSTLLRSVNLLERPDSGRVLVGGDDMLALSEAALRAKRQRIGMIHQHFGLLDSRDVAGNVAFALEVTGLPRRERKARVAELLDLVGLSAQARQYPAQLSGGQKQRVGIARALAAEPEVLLSDEATSALDPETTGSILALLKRLNTELGLTILLITHEMGVVKRICDSAAIMREGRIIESGRVTDLLVEPGSELAKGLFPLPTARPAPDMTVLDVTFVGEDASTPFISTLARTYSIDVNVLGGAIEEVGDTRVGRLRIELPGSPELNAPQIAHLRERGLTLEVVAQEAASPEIVPLAALSSDGSSLEGAA